MRKWSQLDGLGYQAQMQRKARFYDTGSTLDRKYWVALALYVVLAVLVWFTMDASKVLVHGRPVDLRLVPLIVLGGMALRTVLARQADKIRRDSKSSPDLSS
jgi:hypothetical protein